MKKITAEEGLALIKQYQHKNLKRLDPNDATAIYKALAKDRQYVYHFETSTEDLHIMVLTVHIFCLTKSRQK